MLAASSGLDLASSVAWAAGPTEWLSVKDFGARGDGVTDDTAAFAACGRYLRTLPIDLTISILFPAGHYKYREGWHFSGLPRVRFVGAGATLEAPGFIANRPNGFFELQSPFHVADNPETQISRSDQTFHGGYGIATVAAGSLDIQLKDKASSARFSPGKTVFLYGYDIHRSGGFPPSALFFEWNVVKVVDSNTGTVTLLYPTKHAYRDSWYQYDATSAGPARIIDWEARRAPLDIEIGGFRFVSKAGSNLAYSDNRGNLTVFGKTVWLHDVDATPCRLDPSQCERMIVERVSFNDSEFDKLGENVLFRDVVCQDVTAGTGIINTTLERVSVRKSLFWYGGSLTARNCHFPLPYAAYGYRPCEIVLENNSFFASGVSGTIRNQTFNSGPANGTLTFATLDSNGRTVALDFGPSVSVMKEYSGGDLLIGVPRGRTGPAVLATVTGLDQRDSSDVLLVQAAGLIEPNSNLLNCASLEGYTASGNALVGGGDDGLLAGTMQPLSWPRRSGAGSLRRDDNFYEPTGFYAKRPLVLRSVTIDVVRPYTGNDSAAAIRLETQGLDLTNWTGTGVGINLSVDPRIVGRRTVSAAGATGFEGGDVYADFLARYFRGASRLLLFALYYRHKGEAGYGKLAADKASMAPDPQKMPIVSLEFEFEPLTSQFAADLLR